MKTRITPHHDRIYTQHGRQYLMSVMPSGSLIANRYRLDRAIGQGSIATVYRAWDIGLKRWIAIKVCPLAQFGVVSADEARLQAACQHPHLMPLYDAGNDLLLGCAYIVMPLYPGGDLAQNLNRFGPMPFFTAIRCADQICSALEFLKTRRNAIHGDIKPANIWLTDSGTALLMDFNLYGLLARGEILRGGTPGYTALEALNGNPDTRSDVFALGCVLYECLTGQRAFADDAAVRSGKYPPIQPLRPEIFPELAAIVDRALCRDVIQRYQTIREFQTDLRKPFAFHAAQPFSAFLRQTLSRSMRRGYGTIAYRCRRFFRHSLRHPLQAAIELTGALFVLRWLFASLTAWGQAHPEIFLLATSGVIALALWRLYRQWKIRNSKFTF